jgi:hypothetical protein
MRDNKIIEILCDYGLKSGDLSTMEWKQIGEQQPDGHFPVDESTMHRIARLVAVNKMLKKQKGGEPLTWSSAAPVVVEEEEEPPIKEETEDTKAQRAKVGLSADEWACVSGEHGVLLGVNLCKQAFERMWRKCKTKRALKLRGDVDKSKTYLLQELQKVAAEMVKRKQKPTSTMLHFQKRAREIVRSAQKCKREA